MANLTCLVRKGFAIRIPKSKAPSKKVQEAIQALRIDAAAKRNTRELSKILEMWDGPKMAAELLYQKFGEIS
jgi:UDP:flavonoid glycosyltransferase YjiC (YdhE family)